jgi:hypothetical protein
MSVSQSPHTRTRVHCLNLLVACIRHIGRVGTGEACVTELRSRIEGVEAQLVSFKTSQRDQFDKLQRHEQMLEREVNHINILCYIYC